MHLLEDLSCTVLKLYVLLIPYIRIQHYTAASYKTHLPDELPARQRIRVIVCGEGVISIVGKHCVQLLAPSVVSIYMHSYRIFVTQAQEQLLVKILPPHFFG